MAITCNFDKDDNGAHKDDRIIVRIPPVIGEDTPARRPVKHGAYLWVMSSRRRSGKTWRDLSPVGLN